MTAEDGSFDSEMISAGGSWARTFETAGTFAYVCAFHPQMKGVVEVTAGEVAAASPAVPATRTGVASPRSRRSSHLCRPNPRPNRPPSRPRARASAASSWPASLIVGLLIGGAFLLFVRAVGGSVRSHPDEA